MRSPRCAAAMLGAFAAVVHFSRAAWLASRQQGRWVAAGIGHCVQCRLATASWPGAEQVVALLGCARHGHVCG